MREFIFKVMLKGEERRVMILNPMEGLFKVYWDALYLGTIEAYGDAMWGIYWDTDESVLQECCQSIGEYIESCLM